MAAHFKKAADERAHIVLIDETGLLMSPLSRRTLAPRGETPVMEHKAKFRQKVSVTAAITVSPLRRQLHLYTQTWPEQYVDSDLTAVFLRNLLHQIRGNVIVVWDRGQMHKGDAVRRVLADYPRLSLEDLPAYAPDLDPVEFLWKHLKWDELANYCPTDITELHETTKEKLEAARGRPERLRQFFRSSGLPLPPPDRNPALAA